MSVTDENQPLNHRHCFWTGALYVYSLGIALYALEMVDRALTD